MKTICMMILLVTATTSFAGEAFNGRASFSTHYKSEWTALKKDGIKYSALLEAMAKCNEAGNRNCVFINARIEVCGEYAGWERHTCDAVATVIAVD